MACAAVPCPYPGVPFAKPPRIFSGTVKPAKPFLPEEKAEELYNAMKGVGTKESVIMDVCLSHTNDQRQIISGAFKKKYGQELCAEVNSELSGDFRTLVIALLDRPAVYDAKQLRKAIEGIGTDETTLIEILCSRSIEQLDLIREEYKKLYNQELLDDIADDTSGTFRALLVALVTTGRDTSDILNPEAIAKTDAVALYEAGEGRLGTNETTFTRILTERSFPQLVMTFDEYKKTYNKEFEEAVKAETSFSLKEAYLAIVMLARYTPRYFAERLYKSMKGLGTNDNVLIRNMVTRSEVDMVQVKSEFFRVYGSTLESFITGDTSGNYRNLLLGLCLEKPPCKQF